MLQAAVAADLAVIWREEKQRKRPHASQALLNFPYRGWVRGLRAGPMA